jgi:hypothetical protein
MRLSNVSFYPITGAIIVLQVPLSALESVQEE